MREGSWLKGDRVVPGWFDLRGFGGMSSVAGAGVGGGSLHYANVSIPAPADAFDAGWPPEINPSKTIAALGERVAAHISSVI